MVRILQLSAKYPWQILIMLIILTAVAATRLPYLKVQVAAESMAVEGDPAWIAQQNNLKKFKDSAVTVVLFRDAHLFTAQKLKIIQSIADDLSTIKDVSSQTSLFTTANIQLQDENVLTQPYLEKIPSSQQALDVILRQANLNPLVAGNLINASGAALAINLNLKSANNDPAFDHRVSDSIERIIAPHRAQFDSISQIGATSIRDAISKKIRQDQLRIMPWSILVLFLALALGIRQVGGAFIPLFTAGISIIWTLAAMAFLDIPLGVMTSIVPALLVIIGSTEDVHLIAEYKAKRQSGMSVPLALEATSRATGMALLLTFVTTWFGFISIYFNEIKVLQEFGLVASSALLINFIITILSVPAILKITSRERPDKKTRTAAEINAFQRIAVTVFRLSIRHARMTVLLFVMASLLALYGATRIKVNDNPLGYFDRKADIVKNTRQMHQQLAGIRTFYILLETGIEDTFLKVRYLQEIEKIQQYLSSSKKVDKTISLADFIKVIHLVMEEDQVQSIDQLYLPDDDSLVREYMLFIKHDLVSSYVNDSYDSARIIVRHDIQDSSDLQQLIDELKQYIQANIDPALQVQIAGSSVVSANAANYMATGQLKSSLLMAVVIIAVVAILFVNWKAGVIALIPNLFPVIVLFGVMGFGSIELDTGTVMVAVIALGICVDDTVHFMTRYHHNTRNRTDTDVALEETVLQEAVPVITTSLALIAGFLTFSLSSFIPIANFGLLSALVILMALLTTFIITPLLLSWVELVTMWDMLSLKLQARVVNDCPLFKGFSPWQIKQSILASEVKYFKAGASIIEQGSTGDEMYVILEGAASVKIAQNNGSVTTVNTMSEGDLFGEIALVSKIPRTASVIAAKDCRLLTIRWESIERFSRLQSRVASKLFKNLASIVGSRLTRLENMAVLRDEYSGALHRGILQEIIDLEIHRSQRFHEPVAFVCFTLCCDKSEVNFNKLLNKLSSRIRRQTRKIDTYGRWSDRRFVFVLARTGEAEAREIANRLEQIFRDESAATQSPADLKITVLSYDGESPEGEFKDRMEAILNAED